MADNDMRSAATSLSLTVPDPMREVANSAVRPTAVPALRRYDGASVSGGVNAAAIWVTEPAVGRHDGTTLLATELPVGIVRPIPAGPLGGGLGMSVVPATKTRTARIVVAARTRFAGVQGIQPRGRPV